MSTTEIQALPPGSWAVDRVHATVGSAVEYMAGTFTGTFSDFDASVIDGVLNPLPNGEPALANEVVLTAELQVARQA